MPNAGLNSPSPGRCQRAAGGERAAASRGIDAEGGAYCSVGDLLVHHDSDQVAALLSVTSPRGGRTWLALGCPQDPAEMKGKLRRIGFRGNRSNASPPSYMEMKDPGSDAGKKLAQLGCAVMAAIDAACLEGGVYERRELQALTGPPREYLRKFAANLWFLRAVEQWAHVSVDPDSLPGARQALADLDALKKGLRVFGFPEPNVTRVGNTVVIAGHELELTPQLAVLLELALAPGGLPFADARVRMCWTEFSESAIRARVGALRKSLRRETRETRMTPFLIEVTTKRKTISARVRPEPKT